MTLLKWPTVEKRTASSTEQSNQTARGYWRCRSVDLHVSGPSSYSTASTVCTDNASRQEALPLRSEENAVLPGGGQERCPLHSVRLSKYRIDTD